MNSFNPAPLGLFGFALTTWLLSMINAGWLPETGMGMVLAMAYAYGGTAQFTAGLGEMKVGNTFGFVAFCSYGAFWWSFALFVGFFAKGVPASMVGWYLLLWGIFTFAMFIGTLAHNTALQLVFGALTATFILLAFGALLGAHALSIFGGYIGLLTAAFAAYLGAAIIINGAHGKTILPVGEKS